MPRLNINTLIASETYFAMGLLHDIGRLIFCFKQLEQQEYGFSHDGLGAAFLRKWQRPDAIITTTLHHHSTLSSIAHHYAVSIIHVADWMSHTIPLGYNGEHFAATLSQCVPSLMGFEENTLNTIIDTTKSQFNDNVKLLM